VRGSQGRAGLAREAGASDCARELDGGSREGGMHSIRGERWSPAAMAAAARNLINNPQLFTYNPLFWIAIHNCDPNIYK
jgi:hypothetical protein